MYCRVGKRGVCQGDPVSTGRVWVTVGVCVGTTVKGVGICVTETLGTGTVGLLPVPADAEDIMPWFAITATTRITTNPPISV